MGSEKKGLKFYPFVCCALADRQETRNDYKQEVRKVRGYSKSPPFPEGLGFGVSPLRRADRMVSLDNLDVYN